jgi:hypothetical protein
MINFFLLSLPIFAVIGVGWAATRASLVTCKRGELSVRGLARARLKRVAIRANVHGGFNHPVTLRNPDLSGPGHTDWYAFNALQFEIPELVRVA